MEDSHADVRPDHNDDRAQASANSDPLHHLLCELENHQTHLTAVDPRRCFQANIHTSINHSPGNIAISTDQLVVKNGVKQIQQAETVKWMADDDPGLIVY